MHIFSNMMLRTVPPPSTFEPCIPTPADRPPSGFGWIHEIKHDGFRLIARRDDTGVHLVTRNDHDWCDRYPTIAAAVGRLRCRSCVIDGEVAILDEQGRAVFELLQQGPRVKPEALLFAFDLLELDGKDMRRMPLLTRKSRLLDLLEGASPALVYNEHLEGDGEFIFEQACKLRCEGIVSKRADSPYRSGRSRAWIKKKSPEAIAAQRIRSEQWDNR